MRQSMLLAIFLLAVELVQADGVGLNINLLQSGIASRDVNLGAVDFQCPGGVGIYWHPECDKYYTCYAGQPTYLWQCRDNLLFDLTYNGCNYPELVKCGDRIPPGSQTTTTRRPFVCPSSDGFFPLPDAVGCVSDFYSCVNYVVYPQRCPGINVFDPVTNVCVSPGTGNCGPTTTTTTTAKPFVCPADNGFFPVPDVNGCAADFYSCVNGVSYPQRCPGTSVFDPTTNLCVAPGSGSCVGSPDVTVPASTSSAPATTSAATPAPTTSAPGNAFVCPGDGLFSVPGVCTQYYQCHAGYPYLFNCPAGLVFNPAGGYCDWPYNVPGCTI